MFHVYLSAWIFKMPSEDFVGPVGRGYMLIDEEVMAHHVNGANSSAASARKRSKAKRVAGGAAIVMALIGLLARTAPYTRSVPIAEREYAGRVTDMSGKPVVGATVRLVTQGPPPKVLTDAGGFYTLRGKVASSSAVKITVEMDDYLPYAQFLADSSQSSVEDIRLEPRLGVVPILTAAPPTSRPAATQGPDSAKTTPLPPENSRVVKTQQPKFVKPEPPSPNAPRENATEVNERNFQALPAPDPMQRDAALRLSLKQNTDSPAYVQKLMGTLGQILPKAGYVIVDDQRYDLVLDCEGCGSPTRAYGQLRLASSLDPEHAIWAMIVSGPDQSPGDTASLAFAQLRSHKTAILREYNSGVRK
jgi:hypothetical protein